jgi:hypothetical protein
MTYLAFDVARCSGQTGPAKTHHQPENERGLWPDCVDCLRRTAPWNQYRQVVMLPPEFSQGKCPERIEP